MTDFGVYDARAIALTRAWERIHAAYPEIERPAGEESQSIEHAIDLAVSVLEDSGAPPAVAEYALENVAVAAITRSTHDVVLTADEVHLIINFGWWIIEWFRGR